MCFDAAVHEQAHQTFSRCLPDAAVALLGGQLSGAGHRAVSGSLGRWGRWRRLPGLVGFVLARLAFGLGEDGDDEEEDEEATWQDAHCGCFWKERRVLDAEISSETSCSHVY